MFDLFRVIDNVTHLPKQDCLTVIGLGAHTKSISTNKKCFLKSQREKLEWMGKTEEQG